MARSDIALLSAHGVRGYADIVRYARGKNGRKAMVRFRKRSLRAFPQKTAQTIRRVSRNVFFLRLRPGSSAAGGEAALP